VEGLGETPRIFGGDASPIGSQARMKVVFRFPKGERQKRAPQLALIYIGKCVSLKKQTCADETT
jgi:hypothetical protein